MQKLNTHVYTETHTFHSDIHIFNQFVSQHSVVVINISEKSISKGKGVLKCGAL